MVHALPQLSLPVIGQTVLDKHFHAPDNHPTAIPQEPLLRTYPFTF
jgi:hypothetical protein